MNKMKTDIINFEQKIKEMLKTGEIKYPLIDKDIDEFFKINEKSTPLRKEFKKRILRSIKKAMEEYNENRV